MPNLQPPCKTSRCLSLLTTRRIIDKFQKELELTHAVLFSRSASSQALGERLYGLPIKSQRVVTRSVVLKYNRGRLPALVDFPIFGPRIIHLLRSMEQWHPRTFRELFIPGYSGRLDWWVAMFGAFIGIIAILSLGISCYQSVLGQKQVNLAVQSLNLQNGGIAMSVPPK